jgi:hypothetical protein
MKPSDIGKITVLVLTVLVELVSEVIRLALMLPDTSWYGLE